MTLNEAIQTYKDLGLIGGPTFVKVVVNNGNTENLSYKLFECEMPVKEAMDFFGNLKFITSWMKTVGDEYKYAELVLLVAKERSYE